MLIIRDFFDQPSQLDPVKTSIEELVEGLAQKLYKAGKIKS